MGTGNLSAKTVKGKDLSNIHLRPHSRQNLIKMLNSPVHVTADQFFNIIYHSYNQFSSKTVPDTFKGDIIFKKLLVLFPKLDICSAVKKVTLWYNNKLLKSFIEKYPDILTIRDGAGICFLDALLKQEHVNGDLAQFIIIKGKYGREDYARALLIAAGNYPRVPMLIMYQLLKLKSGPALGRSISASEMEKLVLDDLWSLMQKNRERALSEKEIWKDVAANFKFIEKIIESRFDRQDCQKEAYDLLAKYIDKKDADGSRMLDVALLQNPMNEDFVGEIIKRGKHQAEDLSNAFLAAASNENAKELTGVMYDLACLADSTIKVSGSTKEKIVCDKLEKMLRERPGTEVNTELLRTLRAYIINSLTRLNGETNIYLQNCKKDGKKVTMAAQLWKTPDNYFTCVLGAAAVLLMHDGLKIMIADSSLRDDIYFLTFNPFDIGTKAQYVEAENAIYICCGAEGDTFYISLMNKFMERCTMASKLIGKEKEEFCNLIRDIQGKLEGMAELISQNQYYKDGKVREMYRKIFDHVSEEELKQKPIEALHNLRFIADVFNTYTYCKHAKIEDEIYKTLLPLMSFVIKKVLKRMENYIVKHPSFSPEVIPEKFRSVFERRRSLK